jgi:hypothetical protein
MSSLTRNTMLVLMSFFPFRQTFKTKLKFTLGAYNFIAASTSRNWDMTLRAFLYFKFFICDDLFLLSSKAFHSFMLILSTFLTIKFTTCQAFTCFYQSWTIRYSTWSFLSNCFFELFPHTLMLL